LKNDRSMGLFYGMQGWAREVGPNNRFRFDAPGLVNTWVKYDPEYLNRIEGSRLLGEKRYRQGDPLPFDFAYCITCHKAQGDEWDKVLVFEECCRAWSHARWAYTAASRARHSLDWVLAR
jgi:ATP-dependent exoDNAse (exonuclease V) alpha subunit